MSRGEDVWCRESRKTYTPAYPGEAAHLVIDTGRPIAHVATEIGVGEQVLGRWVRLERAMLDREPAIRAVLMSMSGPSWSGCGPRTPNCGWTGSS